MAGVARGRSVARVGIFEKLVHELGRWQSGWAIQQWRCSVVEARPRVRASGPGRGWVAGVGRLVHGMERWYLLGVFQQWWGVVAAHFTSHLAMRSTGMRLGFS